MTVNLFIEKNDIQMTLLDAKVTAINAFSVCVDVDSVLKDELRKLYEIKAGITFLSGCVHLCISRDSVASIEFL